MNKIKFIAPLFAFILIAKISSAQDVNWKSFSVENPQLINVNIGWDYSTSLGLGYGYRFKTKLPLMANASFSLPIGNNLFDDFKTKAGGQAEVFRKGNFSTTVKVYGIFRRYQSDYVRLLNWGSEFSAVAGYYKSNWYAAGEFGFDKAINTQVQNSDVMLDSNPGLQNGWYMPTGGNFFYGIQGGYSFHSSDITMKIGETVTQDFKTSALIPFYFQLGYNWRF